jgi:macrolide-specific efflux system membrane fusion protein
MKKWILAGAGVVVVIVAVLFFMKGRSSSVSYAEVKVRKGDLVITVQSSGVVSPQNRLEIKPPVPGRIEEVLIKEGDVVHKGKVLAWISSNERAALLDSVRSQGADEIKKWEQLYRPTPVIAPIRGTIILKNVEAGQSFLSTDPIIVMADRLTVKAQVDETDIAKVKIGLPAVITLDAYPNNPVKGKVVHVAYDATVTNNVTTYAVDVLPVEVPDFMRSGMTSNIAIEVERKKDVLLLPKAAINQDQEGVMVLERNNGKIVSVPITVGSDNAKVAEVGGVNEGDIVLIEQKALKGKKNQSNPLFMGGGRGRGGGKR